MKAGIRKIRGNISGSLEGMVKRTRNMPMLWKRILRPLYKSYQIKRWLTENSADGGWKKLSDKYETWKRNADEVKRDGKWREMKLGGQALMVLTGDLSSSISLASYKFAREAVTDTSVEVFTTLPYAEHADKERTFTRFSKEFRGELRRRITNYVRSGK